jgi:hypothetical protein
VVVGKDGKGVVANNSVDAAGTEGDMTSVVGTSTVLAPGGGVKKTTPPAAGTVDESGMVDTPGLFGDGSGDGSKDGSGDGSGDGASGELVGGTTADEGSESSESPGSSAAASKAESVRRSTAMALGLPTAVLR